MGIYRMDNIDNDTTLPFSSLDDLERNLTMPDGVQFSTRGKRKAKELNK